MRRLTLFDLMTLVAATAVGLGMARLYDQDYQAPSPYRFLDWLRGPPSCLAAVLPLALLALRLQRPRPRWIRLMQQPGFAACLGVAFAVVMGSVLQTAHFIARTIQGSMPTQFFHRLFFNYYWHGIVLHIAHAVIGVWVVLITSRRWRAEPTWIDRLGRTIGIYWIGFIFVKIFAPVLAELLPFLP